MNERIRNALLLICVIIVLLIVIDMIFNFSGVRVEKFQSNEGDAYEAGSSEEGEDTRAELNEEELDNTNIKSIVSKKDGRIFNIVFTSNDNNPNTCVIPSPVNPNMNITVNSDGTLGEQLSLSNSSNQKFQLKPIRNTNDLSNHLEGTTRGSDNRPVNSPFYVLVSKRDGFENRVLAYEPGRLYLATTANYDNQKWDVSNLRNPKKSVLTHAVTTNNMGSLNNANMNPVNDEAFDPNKIKINFNLSDELKKQILNLDTENGGASTSPNTRVRDSSQFYGQQCSPQIPKDAISSLCPGCSPDRL